jgi:hypothetical protein
MSKHTYIYILLFFAAFANAQEPFSGEFQTYDNGLIYPRTTMNKLGKMVDSLQLKYKGCEVGRAYRARYQAVGQYLSLTENVEKAQKDIAQSLDFEDFIKKYPMALVERNLLLITEFNNQTETENDSTSKIRSIPIQGLYDRQIPLRNHEIIPYFTLPLQQKWIVETKQTESGAVLQAFYVTQPFASKPMAQKYGQISQFIECMVDTTTQVLLNTATQEIQSDEIDMTKIGLFIQMTNDFPNKPDLETYRKADNSFEYERLQTDLVRWDSLRLLWIDATLSKTEKFKTALREAVGEALLQNIPNAVLEYYCGKYLSAATELTLKRNRLVVGVGAMDASSRYHAREIAVLAAQNTNWEVFLRAHLDIMNDRFDRAADNTYAKSSRDTYIKELEDLGIDVPNLMLGICLRIENPSQNHYYGEVGRIGRALGESKYQPEVKKQLLDMIADADLDDYNRLLMYHLFLTYNAALTNSTEKAANLIELRKLCIAKFPKYLYDKMTW